MKNIIKRGTSLLLVLAMLPGIQCGISLNLGLPIGIIGGLLCIEFGMSGFTGLFFAIAVGLVIAAATGWLYGLLLNRLKGSEMSVTTYVGFSVVSLMCIAWLVLPFKSPIMKWPLGNGLRTTIGLQTSYRHVLNDFLSFEIFGITIPTGLLLFFALCCLLVWLFMRSKTGIAMSAAGANPRFAAATGINVDRMRIIGTMLSTMLAAVGIIVYGQSYGFMQLYQAPRQMGFLAASAILIGFGFGIFIPTFQTMKLNMADRGHRGAVNSTFFTAFDIGVGTGMFLGGKIYAYLNLNWAFGTGALLNLLAIVYFYRISLDHYRKNKLGVDSD